MIEIRYQKAEKTIIPLLDLSLKGGLFILLW